MNARIDRSIIPVSPDLSFESTLWSNHVRLVAGIDEAGRGAWAGPVVAAAVILPSDKIIENILSKVRDSKQLSTVQREEIAPLIKACSSAWGVGFADNLEIDQWGILPATRMAMMRAVAALELSPDHLLIDALFLPDLAAAQTALIKGDQRSLSIAAASILAKTARDAWMVSASIDYPNYQFDRHKGYGTRLHQVRLAENGKCDLHRTSYKPIREIE